MTVKQKYLKLAFWLLLTAGSGTLALFSGIYLYLSPKLPEVETLRQVKLQTPLRVFSTDGQLIGEFGEKRRTPISIEEAPQQFIDAILAAEDDRFYSHPGVDIKGLLRAASQLLQSGQIQTGGSTITMQVARNFFLTRKQTFTRKFNEILLALQIEKELTKPEILELYINKIYLGNRAYGIEAAAQVYYGKSIGELNLAQLAMVAGLPKAPSAYNPIVNPERALLRRNWILGRMLSLDYIDAGQYNQAVEAPVTAVYHGSKLEVHAPYIAEMARKEALDLLGPSAYTDGFRLYTTVNSRLQERAQSAVVDGLLNYDQRHGYRGPQARLPLPEGVSPEDYIHVKEPDESKEPIVPEGEELTDVPLEEEQEAKEILPLPLLEWQKALKDYRKIGGLHAVAVTALHEKQVEFVLADGDEGVIEWDNGLSSARAYISENRRGPKPKSTTDLFTIGDVIRVRQKGQSWHLSQIPAAQAALVALNPQNGAIISLVGGFDFYQSHFNRAIQAERQPGSNFKPFIYTAALENGLTPATVINDAPIVFDDASLEGTWRPENASGKFFGPTRLRRALYKSRNLVSIRVLRSIGVENAIAGMDRYGFDPELLPKDLSLALGSYAMTPLQVATGYTVFANGGYKVAPFLIERIENVDNQVVYQAQPDTVCQSCEELGVAVNTEPAIELSEEQLNGGDLAALESAMAQQLGRDQASSGSTRTQLTEKESPYPVAERVMSRQVAWLVDDMLRDVIKKGTGRRAKVLERNDLAGKTGTTNGPKDAWFSGYNSHIVATTWLGFDQNLPLGKREYGGTSALPIWIDYMRMALDGVPETARSLPDGLVSVRIDPATGKRARPNQKDAIFETFETSQVPALGQEPAPNLETSGRDHRGETLPEELF
ncbi:penicillin-binding protein 1A [Pseudomaricurvus alkylphenolicus]|jgi:penicillin-binding protein 1A|uniref:penicillin-binding protein 1A n=1 Tax=Pseudomaricurvus alkylphenolicus TaxID=1306991 RepID=UPI00142094B0|nr:penicillin-binding protein 1A [Pseudomaricurvus alkylphenolicus]NIB39348.1 penicillin-binding protein 1A [Pseudomaricurvus alkylphenolicus]